MSPEMHGATSSWSIFTLVALFVCAPLYLRGWYRLNQSSQSKASAWRVAAFLSGELLVSAVVASPLARLDHQWLTAHMVQHLVLMTLAAPLILMGEPALMFLNSMPRQSDAIAPGPLLPYSPIRGIGRIPANPAFCWLAGVGCVIGWHIPGLFDLCMQSGFWHGFEQASFLAAGILFWWPVVQPWPGIARWHRWSIPLYLFLATIPCDALSAFLAFGGRVVYPAYAFSPQFLDNSTLRDQEVAGAMMWVWVTLAYLIPAVVITMQILSAGDAPQQQSTRAPWAAPAAHLLNGREAKEL